MTIIFLQYTLVFLIGMYIGVFIGKHKKMSKADYLKEFMKRNDIETP